jgi:hypothetical protein
MKVDFGEDASGCDANDRLLKKIPLAFFFSTTQVDNPVHNLRLSRNDHRKSAAYVYLTKV